MKKILGVFDGRHFSQGAFDFVARLTEVGPVLFTGIFLPAIDYSDAMIYYFGGMVGPLYFPDVENEAALMDENIRRFEMLCQKHNIEYRVHRHTEGNVTEALNKESRYADVLILGSELFYENLGADTQKEYMHETLHKAECPVILVPEHYTFPESVIIAFDGSDSSVFAIKQFSYLFPELTNKSTLVVYASANEKPIPDLPYIEELAARHFSDLTFLKLDIDPKTYFGTWVSEKGSAILVAGAYSRSSWSELFKGNFAKEVISGHKLPLFIAHH